MTTAIASGLGATFGFGEETGYNTFKTPDHFLTFNKETLKMKKNTVQSKALHGGLFDLASRRAFVTRTINGAVDLDLLDRGQGLIFKHMLGNVAQAPMSNADGTYTAVFTPGDLTGKSLTLQVGRPETTGNLQPFSFTGTKITDWQLHVQSGQQASLSLTVDGAAESISQPYAAPSFVASDMLHFGEAALLIGGTVTTTGGIASVTGNSSLAVVKSAQLKGTNAMDTSRFFLGANGVKAEPLANAFRAISGQLDVEFENTTDVYNAFSTDTPTALLLTFTGPVIGTGTANASVQVLIPRVYFDDGEPTVDGPGILHAQVNFTGLDDGTNPPIQIKTVSLDATL